MPFLTSMDSQGGADLLKKAGKSLELAEFLAEDRYKRFTLSVVNGYFASQHLLCK